MGDKRESGELRLGKEHPGRQAVQRLWGGSSHGRTVAWWDEGGEGTEITGAEMVSSSGSQPGVI